MNEDKSMDLSHDISTDYANSNQNKVITSQDVRNRSSKSQEKNCCLSCLGAINAFIWQNEASLMKTDHLKAAPCVTTKFLAILRLGISIVSVIQTVFTIIETSNSQTSFEFISQWNLLVITVLFAIMAIIEIKHTRRLNNFAVNVAPLQIQRDSAALEGTTATLEEPVLIEEDED